MLPFDIGFAFPWAFLALPLLLLLPRRHAWGWRLLALTLLVTALAQPGIGRPSRDVAVLIDVSDSVGTEALAAAEAFDFSQLSEPPSVFYFASDATEVPAIGAEVPRFLETSSTDLARALQVAAASGAKRTLLISDGAESVGSARLAVPSTPVDTFRTRSRPNARLTSLLAPDSASPGEAVEVVAIVESDQAATITLRPSVGTELLDPITVEVPAGKTSIPFSFQVGDGESVRVSAAIEADFEQPTSDDGQVIDIAVSEREPVLVINDPATSRLLRAQGFDVVDGSVADVRTPLRFSAIVIRESAGQFTPGQLELLRRYVENGGGLLMTGGPESFGFGSWYRTPVEEVLPVNTDLRTEVDLPLVALVIVLDRSQSMSTGNPSKIELAKEGAISVVELAYQEDLLGLIVFSDESSTQWVFPLRRATDRGKQEMLNAILGINTQGGTVLRPAYEMALQALIETDAAVKHIIILSDGKLYDGQGPFSNRPDVDFNELAARGLAARITTSTIAIGSSADFERLEAIASAGGGRYYQALDVNTLPQIFTSEALTATRSLLREEPFSPVARQHPLSPVRGSVPSLDAYIATTLKADAEVLIEGLQDEPVLAVRRQGLGRTAALTTDLNAWAGEFGRWQELPALLGTVTRWLQARPADYSASVRREGSELLVVVDAVKDGEYVNNKNLEVRFAGQQQPLEQVAPGRYEGRIASSVPGGTLLVIDGSEVVARTRVSTTNPEFDTVGAAALMRDIAELSGGQVIEAPGTYAPLTPAALTPIWPLLALAGLAVFLLELVVRRFGQRGDPVLASEA